MQDRVVDEYVAALAPRHLVPDDAGDLHLLLELFVLEKALYEVRYELGHRPEWLTAPLAAVVELVGPVAP
jgi:maltose alpha-D-glucosyltransferase/alpha-amylase